MTEHEQLRKQVADEESKGAPKFVSSRENRTDTGMTVFDAVKISVVIFAIIILIGKVIL